MSKFFRIFQHLLPKSRAWKLIVENQLREFFEGLQDFQSDYKLFTDQIYEDIDPARTRELPRWEKQFQLSGNGSDSDRRAALDSAWKAQGGQSPGYLQGLLQDAGFDVYVHEWWFFDGPTRLTRDPRIFLNGSFELTACGEPDAACGEPNAVCGGFSTGSVLVNKGPGVTFSVSTPATTCGEIPAVCGEPDSVAGEVSGTRFAPETYVIPDDPTKWPFFVYVGGQIFPASADVPLVRKIEFERLILKYFPDQLWVGLLINYV